MKILLIISMFLFSNFLNAEIIKNIIIEVTNVLVMKQLKFMVKLK